MTYADEILDDLMNQALAYDKARNEEMATACLEVLMQISQMDVRVVHVETPCAHSLTVAVYAPNGGVYHECTSCGVRTEGR